MFGFGVAYFWAGNVTEAEARWAALWATVIVLGWVAIFCAVLTAERVLKDPFDHMIAVITIVSLPMLPGILASRGFGAVAHAIGLNTGGTRVVVIGTAILLIVNWYFYFRLLANRIHIRAEGRRQRAADVS
jgi:hypothetical protein